MLSSKQSRILQFIKDHTERTGRSPSVRAIAAAVGLRSPASVQSQLKALDQGGYLSVVSARPRVLAVNFSGTWPSTPANSKPDGDHGDALTGRERRILEFIRDAVNDLGYPPSIREICDEVGLTSTSTVHSQLQTLEKKGFLRRDPTKPRAIEIYVDQPAPVVPRPLPAYAPLLSGPIAAGTGVLPDDQIEEMLPLPRDLVGQGELFVLRVQGDSMIEAGIYSDDLVVVRRQPTAENGDIVAALVPTVTDESGEKATVKRWSMKNGRVRLMPANPAYHPIDGDDASVLGKVVAVLRRL